MNRYPDRPPQASDGSSFAVLCVGLFKELLGEDVVLLLDRRSQFSTGDSEKYEFKHLQKSYHRLHIELAERTSVRAEWCLGGVMRNDTAPGYVCGHDADIFVFNKDDLRSYHQTKKPEEVWYGRVSGLTRFATDDATIKSFVLPKGDALSFAVYRFSLVNGRWGIWRGVV